MSTRKPKNPARFGTLILCRTDDGAHEICRRLEKAGFRPSDAYDRLRETRAGVGQLILVGSSMDSDDPTEYRTYPGFDGYSFSDDFRLPVSRILAAGDLPDSEIARIAKAAGAKPLGQTTICLADLRKKAACADGIEWFRKTFGAAAKVKREAVAAALAADGGAGASWTDWLDRNFPA